MRVERTEVVHGLEITFTYEACEVPCASGRETVWQCTCGERFEDSYASVSRTIPAHTRACGGSVTSAARVRACARCR